MKRSRFLCHVPIDEFCYLIMLLCQIDNVISAFVVIDKVYRQTFTIQKVKFFMG